MRAFLNSPGLSKKTVLSTPFLVTARKGAGRFHAVVLIKRKNNDREKCENNNGVKDYHALSVG
jgi:hypothetical protein